jgi:hypothetical protein
MSHSLEFLDALDKLTSYITRNSDGTLTLNCATGTEIGISEAIFTDLTKSLARTNELIRAGDIDPTVVQ